MGCAVCVCVLGCVVSYPDFINIIGIVNRLAEVAVSGRYGSQEQLQTEKHGKNHSFGNYAL